MIEITIPKKTPSVNHLYGQRGFRKFIKKEGKELREYIIGLIKQQIHALTFLNCEMKLRVEVNIHENWFTQKNEVARKDIANREKFLIDSVFMALGIDDKFIFIHTMNKIQSKTEEKAIIRIEEIGEKETVILN